MSILKKVSRQQSKPQTARAYEKYIKEIYGVYIKVKSSQYVKFVELDRKLIAAGIFPEEYTERVLRHLKSWVKNKGWKCLPVNVFLGDWAYNLYITDIGDKVYYDITDKREQEQILVVEDVRYLMAVMEYGDKALDLVAPFMSTSWLESVVTPEHTTIRQRAQTLLQRSM